ncbi:hypothetical protein GPECTOR_11g185 [Gonium pectorale]|uniref:HNH domain-containing protein n=1 Tax=Gonium pectorale TaxID=33097 RepID=A0A150GPT0_GONPE|nr:hypothetical protein GPECTOR_11g185 [Gonium pectorale]|eukprot:KXZ51738.1 hypothetical protein GPECTOR_11g185 [Gonium pectorale]
MPARQKECAFGTCGYACILSDYRVNFLRAYPDGYPARGSGVYTCRECGYPCTVDEMDVDHMKPKKLGGTNCVKNLQPLCGKASPGRCNQHKGDKYSLSDKFANKFPPTVRRGGAQIADAFRDLKLYK